MTNYGDRDRDEIILKKLNLNNQRLKLFLEKYQNRAKEEQNQAQNPQRLKVKTK